MKTSRWIAVRCLALMACALPSRAMAQAGGGRGGAGGMNPAQQVQQVVAQLDLTDDQKTKVKDILKQAQQDARDAMQGMQDATPEERRAKMQDVQKVMTDAQDKIVAELTPDQKAKYYPLSAKLALKRGTEMLAALKTAAGKQDITDDLRKQVASVVDDTGKTLDADKADADAVTDAAGLKDFQQKLMQTQMDVRKQLVDILGQDDAQTLMQSARRASMGGNARTRDAAPTTAPAGN